MAKIVIVGSVNASDNDDICRTLKAQYYKNNINNLLEQGAFGCTGVYVYVQEVKDEK